MPETPSDPAPDRAAPATGGTPAPRLRFVGTGLQRPECVLCHASGALFASDWAGAGGVSILSADGTLTRIAARSAAEPVRPNGIALEPGGTFLLAHLGAETGGIFRLRTDGALEPVVTAIDGAPLPPTNFVVADRLGRLWITVSTRRHPRALDYRAEASSGFVALHDRGRTRVVADGLGYTNECALSADGRHLFVNETFARRLTRFAIADDGALSDRTTVATFGAGTFPDGLALDAEDGLWVTSIVSNRVIRVAPGGGATTILEDSEPSHLDAVERAFRDGVMGRPHLDTLGRTTLRNVSSLAFGGADLRTAYLGCLLGDSIATFPTSHAGLPPVHWNHDLGPLASMVRA